MATANRNINSEHAVKLMQKIQIMEGDVTLIAGKDSQKYFLSIFSLPSKKFVTVCFFRFQIYRAPPNNDDGQQFF